jgi:anthranilate synthase component 1
MPHEQPDIQTFTELAASGNLIPIYRRICSDQLTPVMAYRRLVQPDERTAPSFLLESVVGGDRQARYSFMGARPAVQILARGKQVERLTGSTVQKVDSDDPLTEMARWTQEYRLARPEGLPAFTGGWVGFAGYDTVRYAEGEKLTDPPQDDRQLPDMHFGLYRQVVAFDHARKTVLAIHHVLLDEHDSIDAAYASGCAELDTLVGYLQSPSEPMADPDVDLDRSPTPPETANMTAEEFEQMVVAAKSYISAGDIFQVVLSQRFERITPADPFDIYRSLRMVNPSPYMFYLQSDGCMLIGSSPEILCQVQDGQLTNRPLAGTRRRGRTQSEDVELERDLLADPKERAEHIMLVDLGRNDVGRVAVPGTVELPAVMEVERYSHVMHISSTVIGQMRPDLDCWDALRATLPVGTVSGAPKIRAMQIIDELEPHRRGPYAGAVGYADFDGNMDMAIALRTMVVTDAGDGQWRIHLQAGAGIVADSDPATEYQETVSKAAALAKAVDVAQSAFSA